MKSKTAKKWLKAISVAKTVLILLLLPLLYFLAENCVTYYHESAHQAIYASYGIESTIVQDWILGGGYTLTFENCPGECDKLQNYVEIVGYHMNAFLFNLWCMLWFYLIVVYIIIPRIKNGGGA
jgi:hypothetical protein